MRRGAPHTSETALAGISVPPGEKRRSCSVPVKRDGSGLGEVTAPRNGGKNCATPPLPGYPIEPAFALSER